MGTERWTAYVWNGGRTLLKTLHGTIQGVETALGIAKVNEPELKLCHFRFVWVSTRKGRKRLCDYVVTINNSGHICLT
jgi:hypothetical protein